MRKLLLLLFVGIGITFVNERLQGLVRVYKFYDYPTVAKAWQWGARQFGDKNASAMCGQMCGNSTSVAQWVVDSDYRKCQTPLAQDGNCWLECQC